MLHKFRVFCRNAACCAVTLMLLCAPAPAARARTTTVILTTGSARAVVDGRMVTMLVAPVIDPDSRQVLVPIGFLARQFGLVVSSIPQSVAITLSSPGHAVLVTPGSLESLVDGYALRLSVPPRGLLGEVLVAASDVRLLLAVQYLHGTIDGELVFIRSVEDPVVEGSVDVDAVTLETRREQVFMQTVDFSIVRIDMAAKGIRVLSCQSIGGLGTGRYPSAYVDSLKPLALMNATPFNLVSNIMSGSVQDQGTPVYYSGTYVSTIGIDADNTPFYVEGTARAVVRLDTGRNFRSPRQSGSGRVFVASVSLYSNYFVVVSLLRGQRARLCFRMARWFASFPADTSRRGRWLQGKWRCTHGTLVS